MGVEVLSRCFRPSKGGSAARATERYVGAVREGIRDILGRGMKR